MKCSHQALPSYGDPRLKQKTTDHNCKIPSIESLFSFKVLIADVLQTDLEGRVQETPEATRPTSLSTGTTSLICKGTSWSDIVESMAFAQVADQLLLAFAGNRALLDVVSA